MTWYKLEIELVIAEFGSKLLGFLSVTFHVLMPQIVPVAL
jgi:hypothetical protein